MDSSEREIYNFLQTWGSSFVNAKEICRRASTKKRYHDEPDWARPLLQNMVDKGLLERDLSGRYRIKATNKKKHAGRWVSPDIAELLKEKGVEVDVNTPEIGPEDSD
jgi:hypothetical protein